MRLIAVVAVLLVIAWLAATELMAGAAHSPGARNAESTVDRARSDLQRNEAQGQKALDSRLQAIPGSQP